MKEKGREEEEKKKRKKRRKIWIHDFEYENFEYGSVCMDISRSISRV